MEDRIAKSQQKDFRRYRVKRTHGKKIRRYGKISKSDRSHTSMVFSEKRTKITKCYIIQNVPGIKQDFNPQKEMVN